MPGFPFRTPQAKRGEVSWRAGFERSASAPDSFPRVRMGLGRALMRLFSSLPCLFEAVIAKPEQFGVRPLSNGPGQQQSGAMEALKTVNEHRTI